MRRRRDAFDNGSVDASTPMSATVNRAGPTDTDLWANVLTWAAKEDRWAVEHLACVWLRRLPPRHVTKRLDPGYRIGGGAIDAFRRHPGRGAQLG